LRPVLELELNTLPAFTLLIELPHFFLA
jgi:hypothetical protein